MCIRDRVILLGLDQLDVSELAVCGQRAGIGVCAGLAGVGGLHVPAMVHARTMPDIDASGVAGVKAIRRRRRAGPASAPARVSAVRVEANTVRFMFESPFSQVRFLTFRLRAPAEITPGASLENAERFVRRLNASAVLWS
mgnify:CR=1 FL=1